MIQVNNALAEVLNQHSWGNSRIHIAFFEGTMPDKAHMDKWLTESTYAGRTLLGGLKAAIEDIAAADADQIGEYRTERATDIDMRAREEMRVIISPDPAEIGVLKTGTPTYFMMTGFASNATDVQMTFAQWAASGTRDIEPKFVIIGTVGDEDSSADIRIEGGQLVSGFTYKLNDVTVNILEP